MSPTELLRETQRAAGDERLEAWHQTLVSDGKELRVLNGKIEGLEATVRQLRERNENIERDVQRYRDRKKIEHEVCIHSPLVDDGLVLISPHRSLSSTCSFPYKRTARLARSI